MKKRILMGLAAGTAVFGTITGLAASLDVSAQKLGSGTATVTSCDTTGVTSDYTFTAGTNQVAAIVVGGIADPTCDGAAVLVQVLDANGTVLTGGHGTATNAADVDTDDNTVSVSLTSSQPANSIASVRVTLDS